MGREGSTPSPGILVSTTELETLRVRLPRVGRNQANFTLTGQGPAAEASLRPAFRDLLTTRVP